MRLLFAAGLIFGVLVAPAAAEPLVSNNGLPPLARPVRTFGESRWHYGGHALGSAASAGGQRIAVLSASPGRAAVVVTIFDAATGRPLVIGRVPQAEMPPLDRRHGLAFSPDGRHVGVTFERDGSFVLDAATGREVWRAKAVSGFCGFDPAGRFLRVLDRETQLIELPSGKVAATWPVGGLAVVTPDGKTYVRTKKVYAEVEIGDTATGTPRHVLPLRTAHNGRENGYALSPDGRTLAVVHAASEIHLIDVATGETRRKWSLGPSASATGYYETGFTPDGRGFIESCVGRTRAWSLDPFGERTDWRLPHGLRHWQFAADGRTMLFARADAWEPWNPLPGQDDKFDPFGGQTFTLTPDGSELIKADRDGRLTVWSLDTGRVVRSIPLWFSGSLVSGLAPSPDGRQLAVATHKGFVVLPLRADGATPARVARTGLRGNTLLAWSPDSRYVYGRQTSPLRRQEEFVRYDAAERRVAAVLPISYPMAVTPDGREIIHAEYSIAHRRFSIFDTFTLHRYDLKTSANTGTLEPDDLRAGGLGLWWVSFSPDGAVAAIASDARIHFVRSQHRLEQPVGPRLPSCRCLDSPTSQITSTAFVPTAGGCSPATTAATCGCGRSLAARWCGGSRPTSRTFSRWRCRPTAGGRIRPARTARSASGRTPNPVAESRPEALWAAAAGDPATAVPAAWKLMETADGRAFVAGKLPPAAKPDPAAVAEWLAALDAPAFADRAAAAKELAAVGRSVEPELRATLRTTASAEVRDRVEWLLARLEKGYTPEELRAVRLVQACEWVGRKEPLTIWATGEPAANLTREATAGLTQLKPTH